jgi:hypothetical protein
MSLVESFSAPFIPNYIEHKAQAYPCRNICLNLEVDILPTEQNTFIFPRTQVAGHFLDLGGFKFVKKHGGLCLQISRKGPDRITIPDPQICGPYHKEEGNWKIEAAEGKLRISEREKETVFPAGGNPQFNVVSMVAKKISKVKK